MDINLTLTFYALLLSALSYGVRAEGRCTDEDLIKLGFKAEPITDESLIRLGVTRYIVDVWVRWSANIMLSAHPRMTIARIYRDLLEEGIEGFDPDCLYCFVQRAECIQASCPDACKSDNLSDDCVRCTDVNCRHGFVGCVGKETISPADHKDFLKTRGL
ncbi:uncharacterized protein BXIN_0551 [Babesia sp. Xinjiang]|uniref:uncharacterized protein n=1 Tax=Babesia sp. Xinjiang TaxID=462227 RepID=UPI000A237952|nr:uncharacterized protein BXIN_0551 [Babesia sp. Xinjiang]ORM41946.1 hypothetical protein BXIN_0551 [Babesia sp. Xinjiang]